MAKYACELLLLALVAWAVSIQSKPVEETPEEPVDGAESNALFMLHNNDFDTIMPDYYDQHPAASMQYQNFQEFYEPREMGNSEYKMDESQFLPGTRVRPPQPLSAEERRTREVPYTLSVQHERQKQQKFKKGTTKSYKGENPWDQFDYDLYDAKHESALKKKVKEY